MAKHISPNIKGYTLIYLHFIIVFSNRSATIRKNDGNTVCEFLNEGAVR